MALPTTASLNDIKQCSGQAKRVVGYIKDTFKRL